MVNVKRNMIITAIWETILLFLFVPMLTLLSQGAHNDTAISWITMFLTWGVLLVSLVMFRRNQQKGLKHRVKIFDIKENGEPVDMFHNDEREWRLMLTAQYVSARVTTLFALIVMVAVPLTSGSIINAGSTIHLSVTLMAAVLTSIIAVGLLISEWSYVIVYFKLDKE
ncbi:MAG: hypothetical protein LKG79_01895 [Furfurilactobacillus sp.]|jgi:hypothetical protein|uniref:DUF3169 domain-containing protein n=1 Tax=Furfurilactobacillus milii TaxID=2888272 RepID=A0ABT6D877_9LACO|nr:MULTISPECIES: hypothetical protein [Furfurilactobacillus]QLE66578.1 hypothetical protein LROSL2_1228 [Furfurilactobacillus rossiae]MCF6160030.1 hypothetical protein [Furfurilactobacillus milii]MCF6162421.1 hypothetical protein [Furfurilactobacillus milii]MCF6419941.1 hypothetical protein [Furfurilactobacillus milii]MCH4010716.1 hypothetical protein [Furfurilactobacillus sp.]